MENIKELNQKIWYRITKVIYFLVFIIILAFGIFIIKGSDYGYSNYNKGYVSCLNGQKYNLNEFKIQDYSQDFNNIFRTNFPLYKQIYNKCNIKTWEQVVASITNSNKRITQEEFRDILFKVANDEGIDTWEAYQRLRKEIFDKGLVLEGYNDTEETYYENFKRVKGDHFLIYPKFQEYHTMLFAKILGFFILLSIIFEIIRRIFYYIVFGRLFPNKV